MWLSEHETNQRMKFFFLFDMLCLTLNSKTEQSIGLSTMYFFSFFFLCFSFVFYMYIKLLLRSPKVQRSPVVLLYIDRL